MKNSIKKLFYLLPIFSLLFLISCDDDDDSLSPGDDLGNVEDYFISFNISGSEEGDRLGYADFQIMPAPGAGTLNTVQIYGADDLTSGVWTWQITIDRQSFDEAALNVATGTYEINDDLTSTVDFRGSYMNIETGAEYVEEPSGTLTISNITDTYVEGTFSFTVKEQFGGAGGQVSITNGEFKAKIDN